MPPRDGGTTGPIVPVCDWYVEQLEARLKLPDFEEETGLRAKSVREMIRRQSKGEYRQSIASVKCVCRARHWSALRVVDFERLDEHDEKDRSIARGLLVDDETFLRGRWKDEIARLPEQWRSVVTDEIKRLEWPDTHVSDSTEQVRAASSKHGADDSEGSQSGPPALPGNTNAHSGSPGDPLRSMHNLTDQTLSDAAEHSVEECLGVSDVEMQRQRGQESRTESSRASDRHAMIRAVEDAGVVQLAHGFKPPEHAADLDIDVLAAGEFASKFVSNRAFVAFVPDTADVDLIPHCHVRIVEGMSGKVVHGQCRLF